MLGVKGRGVDSTWQRSHGRKRGLVAVIVGAERRRRQRSRDCRLSGRKSRAVDDHLSNLWDGSSLGRVELEDAPENGVELQRDREDGPQELRILHESTESAILRRSALPRVASTGEIDEDDSETPDVVRCRSIARVGFGRSCLTFWHEVSMVIGSEMAI